MSEAPFWQLFDESTVAIHQQASKREDLLATLIDLVVAGGKLPAARRDEALSAIVEREKLGSTGLGGGVAIPHVKTDAVAETVSAIAVCSNKIDFRAPDGEPCDVFILLLSPPSHAERHLKLLRWVSRVVRDQDFPRFIRRARSKGEVVSLLREMGE